MLLITKMKITQLLEHQPGRQKAASSVAIFVTDFIYKEGKNSFRRLLLKSLAKNQVFFFPLDCSICEVNQYVLLYKTDRERSEILLTLLWNDET